MTNEMDNRKEIERLLRRFMDGQTSLDEEDRLARYMRRPDVPEEWRAYKEMFAWFDEGMPRQAPATAQPHRRTRRVAMWTTLAAAAAAALTVVTTLPKAAVTLPAVQPQPVVASADTAATRHYDATADSTSTPNRKSAAPRKRSYYKYKYQPAPPKTYYAEAKPAAECADSAYNADMMTAADRLVAEQLELMDKHQKVIMLKVEADSKINDTRALIAASTEADDYQDAN